MATKRLPRCISLAIGNGIEIEDPSAESPLRPLLIELVQSGQYLQAQIQEAADICFDELGIDPPQQGGG